MAIRLPLPPLPALPRRFVRPFRTYGALLRLELIESFTYRTQNLVWVLVGAVPTLFAIVAWLAVYGERDQVGSFSRSDIITYYLVIGIAWYLIGGSINAQIARDIKNGTLAQQLLKPYFALAPHSIGEQTWKIVSFMLALPVYVALVVALRGEIHLSETPARLALTALATLLSATLFIVLEVGLGVLAFWTTDTRNLFAVYDLLLQLASGELVPLALFPARFGGVLTALPFRYTFSFPVEIFLGKLDTPGILAGFAWQVGWLIVTSGGVRILWLRGLRNYSATGL